MATTLGSLILELGIDDSKIAGQLSDARRKALTAATGVERDLKKLKIQDAITSAPELDNSQFSPQLQKLEDDISRISDRIDKKLNSVDTSSVNQRLHLTPTVDESALFALNDHLDLKLKHVLTLNQELALNPLKVHVDDRSLNSLSNSLDKIGSRSEKIEIATDEIGDLDLSSLERDFEAATSRGINKGVENYYRDPINPTATRQVEKAATTNDIESVMARLAEQSEELALSNQSLAAAMRGLDASVQANKDATNDMPVKMSKIVHTSSKESLGDKIIGLPARMFETVVTGTLEGLGQKFAYDFGSGAQKYVEAKTGENAETLGYKVGKYGYNRTKGLAMVGAEAMGYRGGLKEIGDDIAYLGKKLDSFLDPRQVVARLKGFEDLVVATLEDVHTYNDPDRAGKRVQEYFKPEVEEAKEGVARAAGVGLRAAATPFRIRKRANLAQSMEYSRILAESMEVPDIPDVENKKAIALVSGGVDLKDGGPNTYMANAMLKNLFGDQVATVPVPNQYSNNADMMGAQKMLRQILANIAADFTGNEDVRTAGDTIAMDRLYNIAYEAGFNPDSIAMEATRLAYQKKYGEDKQFIFAGTSAGTGVAEEATAISERAGATNVKGFGATLPLTGLTNTASKENFKAFVGTLDPMFLAFMGKRLTNEDAESKGTLKILEASLGAFPGILQTMIKEKWNSGLMAPSSNTEVIEGAGLLHNLGPFLANEDFQTKLSDFLGIQLSDDAKGRPGQSANKSYADMFGELDALSRTLRALQGDQSAVDEIKRFEETDGKEGGYGFVTSDLQLKKTTGPGQEKYDLEYALDNFRTGSKSPSRQVKGQALEDASLFQVVLEDMINTLKDSTADLAGQRENLARTFGILQGNEADITAAQSGKYAYVTPEGQLKKSFGESQEKYDLEYAIDEFDTKGDGELEKVKSLMQGIVDVTKGTDSIDSGKLTSLVSNMQEMINGVSEINLVEIEKLMAKLGEIFGVAPNFDQFITQDIEDLAQGKKTFPQLQEEMKARGEKLPEPSPLPIAERESNLPARQFSTTETRNREAKKQRDAEQKALEEGRLEAFAAKNKQMQQDSFAVLRDMTIQAGTQPLSITPVNLPKRPDITRIPEPEMVDIVSSEEAVATGSEMAASLLKGVGNGLTNIAESAGEAMATAAENRFVTAVNRIMRRVPGDPDSLDANAPTIDKISDIGPEQIARASALGIEDGASAIAKLAQGSITAAAALARLTKSAGNLLSGAQPAANEFIDGSRKKLGAAKDMLSNVQTSLASSKPDESVVQKVKMLAGDPTNNDQGYVNRLLTEVNDAIAQLSPADRTKPLEGTQLANLKSQIKRIEGELQQLATFLNDIQSQDDDVIEGEIIQDFSKFAELPSSSQDQVRQLTAAQPPPDYEKIVKKTSDDFASLRRIVENKKGQYSKEERETAATEIIKAADEAYEAIGQLQEQLGDRATIPFKNLSSAAKRQITESKNLVNKKADVGEIERPDLARELGQQTVDGFPVGFSDRISSLKAESTRLVEGGIIDPMAKGLKIKSPSKVTEYFGKMVAEGFLTGLESLSKTRQVIDETVKDIQSGLEDVAGDIIKVGSSPLKVRKSIQLEDSAKLAELLSKATQVPDIPDIENKESIALVAGGIDGNKGDNTYFARNVIQGLLGEKVATVPVPNEFSNSDQFGNLAEIKGQIVDLLSSVLNDSKIKELGEGNSLDKLLLFAAEAGFNPDAIRLDATRRSYAEKYPDKNVIFAGTSGGTLAAEEATAIANKSGSDVKGFGLTYPLTGLTQTAPTDKFKAFVGDQDPIYLQNFGTGHIDDKSLSSSQKKMMETATSSMNLPPSLLNPSKNTEVFPGLGQAHHLPKFASDSSVQEKIGSFLGISLDKDFEGKQGQTNLKAYTDMFAQFDSLRRTLGVMSGDRDSIMGSVKGKYSFITPSLKPRKTYGPEQEKSDIEYAASEVSVNKRLSGRAKDDATLYQSLMNELSDLINRGDFGKSDVDGLLSKFNKLFGEAPKFDESTIKSIENKAVGKNFSDGVSSGIDPSSVVDSVKSLGETAIQTLEAEWEIASPSKKGYRLGRWLGEGIKQGIEKSLDITASIGQVSKDLYSMADMYQGNLRKAFDVSVVKDELATLRDSVTEALTLAGQLEDASGAIQNAATAAGRIINYPNEAIVAKYKEDVRSNAQRVLAEPPDPDTHPTAHNIPADAKKVIFVSSGFTGTKGKISNEIADKLEPMAPQGTHMVPFENKNFDVSGTLDEAGIARVVMDAIIMPMKAVQNGINEEALRLAKQVYAVKQQRPDVEVGFVGHSAGGFIVREAQEILRAMEIFSQALSMGTPLLGAFQAIKPNTVSLMGEGDQLRRFTGQKEAIVPGVGGHFSPHYLDESNEMREVLTKYLEEGITPGLIARVHELGAGIKGLEPGNSGPVMRFDRLRQSLPAAGMQTVNVQAQAINPSTIPVVAHLVDQFNELSTIDPEFADEWLKELSTTETKAKEVFDQFAVAIAEMTNGIKLDESNMPKLSIRDKMPEGVGAFYDSSTNEVAVDKDTGLALRQISEMKTENTEALVLAIEYISHELRHAIQFKLGQLDIYDIVYDGLDFKELEPKDVIRRDSAEESTNIAINDGLSRGVYDPISVEPARQAHRLIELDAQRVGEVANNSARSVIGGYNTVDVRAEEVGKPVGKALAQGIDATGKEAVEASGHLAQAVIKKMKEEFDMHSPPRVFVAIGEAISKALASGMESARNLVGGAASKVATTAEGAFSNLSPQNIKKGVKKWAESPPDEQFLPFTAEGKRPEADIPIIGGAYSFVLDSMESMQNAATFLPKFGRSLGEVFEGISQNVPAMASLAKGFLVFQYIVKPIIGLLGSFAESSFNVAVEMQSLEQVISLVSGSAAEARKNIAFIRAEVAGLGGDMKAGMQGFSELGASAQGTRLEGEGTRQVFSAVSKAAVVYQMDPEQQGRAFTALSQMMDKSVVSAEELRGQLAESLPGAIAVAARAMGVSTQELGKMMEMGEVMAEDLLPKFAQQLSAETAGGLAGSARTAQSAINKLNNEVLLLQEGYGKTLIPIKVVGMEAATAGIKFLRENVVALSVAITALVVTLTATTAQEIAKFFVKLSLMNETIGLIGDSLSGLFTRIKADFVKFAKSFLTYFALIIVAVDIGKILGKAFGDASGGMKDAADSTTKAWESYIKVLEDAKAKQDELAKPTGASFAQFKKSGGVESGKKLLGAVTDPLGTYTRGVTGAIGGLDGSAGSYGKLLKSTIGVEQIIDISKDAKTFFNAFVDGIGVSDELKDLMKDESLIESTFIGGILGEELTRVFENGSHAILGALQGAGGIAGAVLNNLPGTGMLRGLGSMGLDLGRTFGDMQREQRDVAVGEQITSGGNIQDEARKTLFSGKDAGGDLAKVIELDKQYRDAQQRRSALPREAVEEQRAAEAEINAILAEREGLYTSVGKQQANLQLSVENYKSQIKTVKEEMAGLGNSEKDQARRGELEGQLAILEFNMNDSQQILDNINAKLGEAANRVELLARQFRAVNAELLNAEYALEIQTAQQQAALSNNIGPGQEGLKQGTANVLQQQQGLQKIDNNQQFIQQTQGILNDSAYVEALENAGLQASSTAADIAAKVAELSDSSLKDTLTNIQEFKEQVEGKVLETEQITAQIADLKDQMEEQIYQMGEQMEDMMIELENQVETLEADFKAAANDRNIKSAANGISRSMKLLRTDHFSGFMGLLEEFVSVLGDQLQQTADFIKQKIELTQNLFNQLRQNDQFNMGIPSVAGEGGPLSNGATKGAGTLVGISGNTGGSTGAHLHIQAQGGGRRLTEEELSRFEAGGQPLSNYQKTSEYGMRTHPISGQQRLHGGVDFAMPAGTPLTTTVPIVSVSAPRQGTGGAGNITTVTFADGLVVDLLHQDPSVFNASLGTGGQPVQQAATGSSGGARATGVSRNVTPLLERFEGFHSTPYWDEQQYSWGFGTKAPGATGSISREDATTEMMGHLSGVEEAINRLVKVPLNQNQFDALSSLIYNIGEGAFADSTVLRELNQGNYNAAAEAFKMWNRGNDGVMPGLVNRRQAEVDLFKSNSIAVDPQSAREGNQNSPATQAPALPQVDTSSLTAESNDLVQESSRYRSEVVDLHNQQLAELNRQQDFMNQQFDLDLQNVVSRSQQDAVVQQRNVEDAKRQADRDEADRVFNQTPEYARTPEMVLQQDLNEVNRGAEDEIIRIDRQISDLTFDMATTQRSLDGTLPLLESMGAPQEYIDQMEQSGLAVIASGREQIAVLQQQRENVSAFLSDSTNKITSEYQRALENTQFQNAADITAAQVALMEAEADRLEQTGDPERANQLRSGAQEASTILDSQSLIRDLQQRMEADPINAAQYQERIDLEGQKIAVSLETLNEALRRTSEEIQQYNSNALQESSHEVRGLQIQKMRMDGNPMQAILMEQSDALTAQLAEFANRRLEIEADLRLDEPTKNQLLADLDEIEATTLEITVDLDIHAQARLQNEIAMNALTGPGGALGVNEATQGYASIFGFQDSYGMRQRALPAQLEQQNLSYQSQLLDLAELRNSGKLTQEAFENMKASLEEINNVKLDGIRKQASQLPEVMSAIRGPTQGLFSDLLRGTKTVGEAFTGFIGGLADNIAQFASNQLTDLLFEKLFSGGLGGLFGGEEETGIGGVQSLVDSIWPGTTQETDPLVSGANQAGQLVAQSGEMFLASIQQAADVISQAVIGTQESSLFDGGLSNAGFNGSQSFSFLGGRGSKAASASNRGFSVDTSNLNLSFADGARSLGDAIVKSSDRGGNIFSNALSGLFGGGGSGGGILGSLLGGGQSSGGGGGGILGSILQFGFGLLGFKDGGEVTRNRSVSIPNFASGGPVRNKSALGDIGNSAIADALKREGPGGRVIVASEGEWVLNPGQIAIAKAHGVDENLLFGGGFKEGGTVGRKLPSIFPGAVQPSGGQTNNSVNVTVQNSGPDLNQAALDKIMSAVDSKINKKMVRERKIDGIYGR